MEIEPPNDYRLRSQHDLGAEVRRVARTRAESALDALRDDLEADPVEAVHTARKDMKKLRSLLRLVRAALDHEVYDHENDSLRRAARMLGGARDADVMLETMGALEERLPGLTAATGLLRPELAGEWPDDVSRRAGEAAAIIEGLLTRIGGWPLDGLDKAIDKGLRRAYGRGRNRFAEALEEPSDEAMHEWRKRAKDLWYHLRLLEDAWPGLLSQLAEEVHVLTDHLGDHHDLAVLAERAGEVLAKGQPLADLLDAAERRQVHHEAAAFALGKRIYAEKPKAFGRRMRALREAPRIAD